MKKPKLPVKKTVKTKIKRHFIDVGLIKRVRYTYDEDGDYDEDNYRVLGPKESSKDGDCHVCEPVSIEDALKKVPKDIPLSKVFMIADIWDSDAVWEGPIIKSFKLCYDDPDPEAEKNAILTAQYEEEYIQEMKKYEELMIIWKALKKQHRK